MGKNLIIGALLVAVSGLAYINYFPQKAAEVPIQENEEQCAQVVTPARNPETGDIREFPTPCDVPDSWELIQNDVPGLELEVQ